MSSRGSPVVTTPINRTTKSQSNCAINAASCKMASRSILKLSLNDLIATTRPRYRNQFSLQNCSLNSNKIFHEKTMKLSGVKEFKSERARLHRTVLSGKKVAKLKLAASRKMTSHSDFALSIHLEMHQRCWNWVRIVAIKNENSELIAAIQMSILHLCTFCAPLVQFSQ